MNFRRAEKADFKRISDILKAIDEYHEKLVFDDFYVAEKDNKILGAVQFKENKEFFFLSSLGVDAKYQKQGVASFLINKLTQLSDKKIYLYTVIPDFFKKFGFKAAKQESFLPDKNIMECETCFPKRCVCMIKDIRNCPLNKKFCRKTL